MNKKYIYWCVYAAAAVLSIAIARPYQGQQNWVSAGNVVQSGTITVGHDVTWAADKTLQDSGFAPVVISGATTSGHGVTFNGSGQLTDSGSAPVVAPLTGTSTTQNPGPLLAGTCNTFTITVTGATTGQTASVSAIGGISLGATVAITANVTSANTVTVNECGLIGVTPASATFRAVVQ